MNQYQHRDRLQAVRDKHNAVNTAEANGQIADSIEVRSALLKRVKAGEITLEQCQDELKRIKRSAKKLGLITRQQAFSRG